MGSSTLFFQQLGRQTSDRFFLSTPLAPKGTTLSRRPPYCELEIVPVKHRGGCPWKMVQVYVDTVFYFLDMDLFYHDLHGEIPGFVGRWADGCSRKRVHAKLTIRGG